MYRNEPGQSRWTLPAGRYSAYIVTLRGKDDKQTEWVLRCYDNIPPARNVNNSRCIRCFKCIRCLVLKVGTTWSEAGDVPTTDRMQ